MEYLEYFEKFPDAYAKIVKSLNRIETLSQYLRESGFLDEAASVLSIGCGDGAVEIRLAREMGFSLGVVEPAADYLESCRRGADSAGIELREAHQATLQDYNSPFKYDVVLSLYSWFAFEFDREILKKAIDCRNSRGILLIILQGEASPSTEISALSQASGINLTSERLSNWARKEGFEHKIDFYHGEVSASTYLEMEEFTQAGRDLVSFLLATPWEEISPRLKEKTLAILKQSVKNDKIDFISPCLVFR
jgi:SAM-dependent methyltransferase